MAWRQFSDLRENRALRLEGVTEFEKLTDRPAVDRGSEFGQVGKNFYFRSELDPLVAGQEPVIEWFDTHRIAKEIESPLAWPPDGEGVHPADVADAVFTPAFQGMK